MRVGIVRTPSSPCRCAWGIGEALRALGHEAVLADGEAAEEEAPRLAATCDLVWDHADTFRGRGGLRSCVRFLLEAHGARVVGSSAAAGLRADDKVLAREALRAAGVPVPPGAVIAAPGDDLPADLAGPWVVKASREQMSRGLSVAADRGEALERARRLLAERGQPVLVETFIPGRELALSVVAREDGSPELLPVLEWRVEGGILTEDHKLRPGEERIGEALRADLAAATAERLEAAALRAFAAVGASDYARLDARLAPDGRPYFLEVNTRPSMELHEALVLSAGWAGLSPAALVDRIQRAALARREREGGEPPAPSTLALADLLDVRPGERVLDLGTGTGFLAAAAAARGASVTATDVDAVALEAAARRCRAAGVADRVEFRRGPWFAPLAAREVFDAILATPPQTPGPFPFGPRYGGPDGTEHLRHVIAGAGRFLRPGGGRLWLAALDLANPAAVEGALRAAFADAAPVATTERPFTDAEMEARCPGLPGHLRALRDRGAARFEDRPGGGTFRNRFWRASAPRG